MAAKITAPIAAAGVGAVKLAAGFEKGMSNVQSISGASGKQLDKLSAKAKEMGAKTKFSAKEATDAYQYMAMAGWKAGSMMKGIEPIMKLAGASNEDLATTSDIVTDSLTAFKMTAKETGRFTDVMAAASANSNTNVKMLGESFKYCAPLAGSLKFSVEDVSKGLGLMANSGIKASQAGTSMRALFTRMAKPTKESAAAMKELGISLTNSNGKMKPFDAIMKKMRKSFKGLTEEEQTQYAAMLAGQNGMSGLLAMVNASDKDFKKLSKSIDGSSGACNKMYEVSQNNLNGQLTILKSTVESIGISFGERLAPHVKKLTKFIQSLADKFNGLSKKQQDAIIKNALIAASIGPGLVAFGKLTKGVGSAVTGIGNFGRKLPQMGKNAKDAFNILKGINIAPPKGLSKMGSIIGKIGGKAAALRHPISSIGSAAEAAGGKAGLAGKMMEGILGIPGKMKGKSVSSMKQIAEATASMRHPFKMLGSAVEDAGGKLNFAGKVTGKATKGWLSLPGKMGGKLFAPFTKLGSVFGTVGKAAFTFLGPAGSVVAILGAIAVGGVLVYKNWDKIKKMAAKLGSVIKNAFTHSGLDIKAFQKSVGGLGKKVTSLGKKFGKSFSGMQKALGPVLKWIGGTFFKGLQVYLSGIVGFASGLLKGVVDVAGGLLDALGGVIDFVTGIFTGNWKKAWTGIQEIVGGVFSALVGLVKTPINAVIGLINGAINGINKVLGNVKIPDWVQKLGVKSFSLKIPTIPMLATGGTIKYGGSAIVGEKGPELVNLPKGAQVVSNSATKDIISGKKKASNSGVVIHIAKLADSIVVREDKDIDRIVEGIADKLIKRSGNIGGGDLIEDLA